MKTPPIPENEADRLKALASLNILDTPLDAAFERITRLARTILDVDIAAISLVDKDRQWFKSIQGLNATETPRSISFCGHAILQDDILVVPNALKDDRFFDNPLVTGDPRIRFYAGCPIRGNSEHYVGTLCGISRKTKSISTDQLNSLKDLAMVLEDELIAYAMVSENQQLNKQLEASTQAALTDTLTRLWNRNGLNRILERHHDACVREKRAYCLALMDIDRFKDINDQYGHLAGDQALQQIAKVLLHETRKMDTVGRWGGEEFLLIIDTPSEIHSQEVLERLHQSIANLHIIHDNHVFHSTSTIGVTYFDPQESPSVEQLIARADHALSKGNRTGRNNIAYWK